MDQCVQYSTPVLLLNFLPGGVGGELCRDPLEVYGCTDRTGSIGLQYCNSPAQVQHSTPAGCCLFPMLLLEELPTMLVLLLSVLLFAGLVIFMIVSFVEQRDNGRTDHSAGQKGHGTAEETMVVAQGAQGMESEMPRIARLPEVPFEWQTSRSPEPPDFSDSDSPDSYSDEGSWEFESPGGKHCRRIRIKAKRRCRRAIY